MTEPALARAVMLIRPVAFHANPQTRASNAFQVRDLAWDAAEQQARALAEFDGLVAALEAAGVRTCVFEDTAAPATPDAIFPNNWVSFHTDGRVVLYPMQAENRRLERRPELLDRLTRMHGFAAGDRLDLSPHEAEGRFLEGTGSLVLDRAHRRAYACLSPRTHPDLLAAWGERLGYDVLSFDAIDGNGQPIYHTNVLMGIGRGFVLVGLDAIPDPAAREALLASFAATGHEVIGLSLAQLGCFAGNALALETATGEQVLAMSRRAEDSLTEGQRAAIARHARLVSAPLDTIEDCAGGSVRCMLAEIFLPESPGRA